MNVPAAGFAGHTPLGHRCAEVGGRNRSQKPAMLSVQTEWEIQVKPMS